MKIDDTHPEYDAHVNRWEFYLRSYLGGQDYIDGDYLTRYINESDNEYIRRKELTPMDNHCKNIVHIYSSFLWRIPPMREYGSAANSPALQSFLKDCDLEGRGFNSFMREAQVWSSVYGHVWLMVDKPKSNAGTKAEEMAQDIRPYVNIYTPENVLDWKYERTASGRFKLTEMVIKEQVIIEDGSEICFYRKWTEDQIMLYKVIDGDSELVESDDNALGKIPAVFVPAQHSMTRGIGASDLSDAAFMQKAIYQELSEIEQLIRISNHPTLVKSHATDASAGAGSVISIPDDIDPGLKPYQIQPSGQNLDSVRNAITDKVESINRMSHMGAVRGTQAITQSGVAMQTEFQMLNAKLSEKADILELAEEQLWGLFCEWQGLTPDVEISYPDAFDLRDYDKELIFLQQMRSTGVKSVTLAMEIDKKISDLVLDDELLAKAHKEIEETASVLGDFSDKTQIYSYHIDAGVVTPNEVREKIGLDDIDGGDTLIDAKEEASGDSVGRF